MNKGTVKWFNDAKGYGFITPDKEDNEIFVHFSSVKIEGFKSLKAGQKVKYEIIETSKGKQAAFVEII